MGKGVRANRWNRPLIVGIVRPRRNPRVGRRHTSSEFVHVLPTRLAVLLLLRLRVL